MLIRVDIRYPSVDVGYPSVSGSGTRRKSVKFCLNHTVCKNCFQLLKICLVKIFLGCESIKKCKQLHDQVIADSKLSLTSLFELLLNTSEFELNLKEMLKSMLANRDAKWKESKSDVVKRLVELSDVFSGTIPLTRIEKNGRVICNLPVRSPVIRWKPS